MLLLMAFITATLIFDGLLMAYLNWAFEHEAHGASRIQDPLKTRHTKAQRLRMQATSSIISLTMLFGGAYIGFGTVFVDAPTPAWWVVVHALLILAVYDALYYAMHRWLFHHKKLMRYVHRTHHEMRFPSAEDALWIHPAETIAGLALLGAVVVLLGPVHVFTFALVFAIHSPMNILNHMGMVWPKGHPLALFNGHALAHYGHHKVDIQKNFATLTMLFDRTLGTHVAVENPR